MKTLTLTAFLLFVLNFSFSQKVDENRNFIILDDNSVIYGEKVDFVMKLKSGHYLVDEVEYNVKDVKFYKNEIGTFASLKEFGIGYKYYLAERKVVGKLNLYESKPPKSQSYGTYQYGGALAVAGSSMKSSYYNIGYTQLKKSSYKNLIIDLADNKESVNLLEKFKKIRNKQITCFVIGSAALFTGAGIFIAASSGQKENKMPPAAIALYAVGIGFDVGGIILNKKKNKCLKASIETYNGF